MVCMIDRRMIYVRELAMLNSQNRETYTAFLFALMMSCSRCRLGFERRAFGRVATIRVFPSCWSSGIRLYQYLE